MFSILNTMSLLLGSSYFAANVPQANYSRPIIGILAQELSDDWLQKLPDKTYTSYVAASYIKYIEMSGARVVVIRVNQTEEYYQHIVNSVNGILFPGGNTFLGESAFGRAGRILWKLALDINNKGEYFPVWGTCLGFEMMMYFGANETDWRTHCASEDEVLPLELTNEIWESRLLGKIDYWMTVFLSRENVSINFHQWCITQENFEKSGLDKFFLLLSINRDLKGRKFVSTVEAYNYPFYGTQWHPEKNGFEWSTKEPNIPHNLDAIEVMQYFANFFVQEARRNQHHFQSKEEESRYLVYNDDLLYTRPYGLNFEQIYVYRD